MRLIKEDQRIIGGKRSMNRAGGCTDTIATKKQARTELVHSGADDGWLRGRTCPSVIAIHAATKLGHGQWDKFRIGLSSDATKAPSNFEKNTRLSFVQHAGQLARVIKGFVHDHTAIHNIEDSARGGALNRRQVGLGS